MDGKIPLSDPFRFAGWLLPHCPDKECPQKTACFLDIASSMYYLCLSTGTSPQRIHLNLSQNERRPTNPRHPADAPLHVFRTGSRLLSQHSKDRNRPQEPSPLDSPRARTVGATGRLRLRPPFARRTPAASRQPDVPGIRYSVAHYPFRSLNAMIRPPSVRYPPHTEKRPAAARYLCIRQSARSLPADAPVCTLTATGHQIPP